MAAVVQRHRQYDGLARMLCKELPVLQKDVHCHEIVHIVLRMVGLELRHTSKPLNFRNGHEILKQLLQSDAGKRVRVNDGYFGTLLVHTVCKVTKKCPFLKKEMDTFYMLIWKDVESELFDLSYGFVLFSSSSHLLGQLVRVFDVDCFHLGKVNTIDIAGVDAGIL